MHASSIGSSPSVDVVVDNFRPGVMDRLDLGYESLRRTRPDVICVSMSVAGHSGPLRSMGGFASMGTAFAGLETLVGYEHEEPIGLINFGLGDLNLAINGAIGTLAALRHRDVTGEGQFVDVSMIESALSGLAEPILDYQLNGRLPGVQGNLHHAWFPHGTYACSGEERWVAVSVRNGSDWAGLCEAIGRTEWAADPSLATVPGRRRRRAEIDGAVASWCATQERDQAARRLLRAGVPAMPVLGIQERDGHEHFRARGLVLDHDSPGGEHSHVYATPWLFSDTPARVRCPAPVLGQDDDYVLRDLLGLAGDEIDRLVREEVVR
ncbi:MAG: CoA transferase [Acidimicrobiia bacterium]|nr:CoA transferase [Acidimicrobiia bacterium]